MPSRIRPHRVGVFAVEDTEAQVCWAGLPEGSEIQAGDATVTVGRDVGAASLEGLEPDASLDLTLLTPGASRVHVEGFRTLPSPPGALLCRFATVNDLHVGERRFGLLRTIRKPSASLSDTYPVLCAAAAVDEALAWGAEAVLVKGDLTYLGKKEQWDEVGRLLADVAVDVKAVLGNHDVVRRAVDGRAVLAGHGIVIPEGPFAHDLPGIRLVLGHSAVPRRSGGRVTRAQRHRIAALLEARRGPAFLGLHHYPQHYRLPTIYPPGIPGNQARALLDAVAATNPATLVSTGHSHRNRRHSYGPLVITEIGAPMHYPGTWAGYAVHEGGIRQVVRRVAAPRAIEWTERTRRALLGFWGWWASGSRGDRCFTHAWPGP